MNEPTPDSDSIPRDAPTRADVARSVDWPRIAIVATVGFVTFEALYFSWVDRSLYGLFGWAIPCGVTILVFGRRFFRDTTPLRDLLGRALAVQSISTTLCLFAFLPCERAFHGWDEPKQLEVRLNVDPVFVANHRAFQRSGRAVWIWLIAIAESVAAGVFRPRVLIWLYTVAIILLPLVAACIMFFESLATID